MGRKETSLPEVFRRAGYVIGDFARLTYLCEGPYKMISTLWSMLSLFADQCEHNEAQVFSVHPWNLPSRRGAMSSIVSGTSPGCYS